MNKYFNKLIENNGVCKILLYGNIGENEAVNAADIVEELNTATVTKNPIEIHINSKGGDVFEGIAIINALKKCNNAKIFVDGLAASMAGVIAFCGFPLYMEESAQIMLHSVSGTVSGNSTVLENTVLAMRKIENEFANIIAQRTNQSEEEIRKAYFDGNDHYITAQEALNLRLIDGVVKIENNTQESDVTKRYEALNAANGRFTLSSFKSRLSGVLTLNKEANESEIIKACRDLRRKHNEKNINATIENACEKGWIKAEEKALYKNLGITDCVQFAKIIDQFQAEDKKQVFEIVENAINKGKILVYERDLYTNIGHKLGFKSLCQILSIKPSQRLINRYLELDFDNREKWSIDDWKNYDPQALNENPELYKMLMAKNGETVTRDLKWYRKNKPEFLAQNPEFYKQLIEREYNK